MRVLRYVRPKYACRACEGVDDEGPTVKIAPAPKFALPKSIASASLLAHIVTAKFVDSLPFYRQEQQFKRLGIEISRTLMATWCIQVAEKLEGLLYLLHQEIKLAPLIQIDETSLQVLKEPGRKATSKSYLWVLRSRAPTSRRCQREPSGASKNPLVYFAYAPAARVKLPRVCWKALRAWCCLAVTPVMTSSNQSAMLTVGLMQGESLSKPSSSKRPPLLLR